MSCSSLRTVALVAFVAFVPYSPSAFAQEKTPAIHRWKPVADVPYLQEDSGSIASARPITSVAALNKSAYVVTGSSVKVVRDDALHDLPGAPSGVKRLRTIDRALWALTDSGVYSFTGEKWAKVDGRSFVDVTSHLGQVYGATKDDIFHLESGRFINIKPRGGFLSTDTTLLREDFSQEIPDPIQLGPIKRIGSYSGTLYMLHNDSFALLDGKTFVPNPVDFGALPSPNLRDMLSMGSRTYLATDRGLGVLRGMSLSSIRGPDGLPFEDTTCLAEGFEDDLWIGTTHGAIRKTGNEFHYFAGKRWLPGDKVNDISVDGKTVYIATDAGLGIIRYEPYTLQKKAAWFEREMEEWGFRRLGFINDIHRSGSEWMRGISDNDGGNTAHYLAAMTFKYAATGDEKAREQAVEAFNAMSWLQEITGKPGFFARAVWSVQGDKGKRDERGSGGLPAKWVKTKDGLWLWKGDTSSDEVNAHMYAVSLFHDLAARDREKERARNHLAGIAGHILDHNWILEDVDGKPTRWGRWDPKYLQTPYGSDSIGLNGMEAQTYMHIGLALTGDPKFKKGLDQILKWRYHNATVRQKIVFPPDNMVPWDDELAFFCYHPLLRYAKDPELRSIYLRSLERTWEMLRIQRLPYFNFIYGALTGNDCEAPQAVRRLREYPLDLVNHTFHNSHRADLFPQPGYTPYFNIPRALFARETGSEWGSGVAVRYDGGNGGNSVTAPSGWLEDYWMGRYYGFITPPAAKDAAATTLSPRPFTHHGADPYSGPCRPAMR